MTGRGAVRVRTEVERKDPSLPRFVVVPAARVAAWKLQETTVVEVALEGVPLGRRSLKRWGSDRDVWFLDLTEAHCRRAGVDTGDRVEVEIRMADTALPEELRTILASDSDARAAWDGMTASARRRFAEHVRAGKAPETRRRRAAKIRSARPKS